MPEHKGAFCTLMLACGPPQEEQEEEEDAGRAGRELGWSSRRRLAELGHEEEQEQGGARCRSIKVHFGPLCLPAARRGKRLA